MPATSPNSNKASPRNEKSTQMDDKKITINLHFPCPHKANLPAKRKASPKLNQSHRNDSFLKGATSIRYHQK